MVVILHHILVAAYLYFRNREWFMSGRKVTGAQGGTSSRSTSSSTMGIPDQVQDALLRLSAVITSEQLETALTEALELALPSVSDVVVYLQSNTGQELISRYGLLHALPKESFAWEAVQKRQRLISPGLKEEDPLSGLLKTGTVPLPSNRKVVCSPVEDKETNQVVAVSVIVCNTPSPDDHQYLSFIEKQLLVCLKRLRVQQTAPLTCHGATANNNRSHVDTKSILNLCAELYDQDAASLQLKVLRYLQTHTHAQSGFLLLVAPDHRELFCQVMGDAVLAEEMRFPVDQNSFSTVIKTKRSITLDDINPEHHKDLEETLGYSLDSLLCVPVIIQEQVVAIACLTNKQQATRFTEEDSEVIRNCFKYTATVLHSTLAVQNERRLKNQTESLLQVARNLFTHLDDLTVLLGEIMQEARNLTKAERCSVFLLERMTNELVAKVFDGDVNESKEDVSPAMQIEVRIPANQGIAGHVATTGEILNIDDAYSHPLFYRGVDETTGFRTRNILCFPIKDEKEFDVQEGSRFTD